MNNLKLCVHHIGGRAGSRRFPKMNKFEEDIVNVIYDADEDCIEQVKNRNISLESELHVFDYAISDKCKSAILNINYDPYTSSLLETNKFVDSFYMFYNDHDYIIGETAKTVEKRDVKVVSLDHIINSDNLHLEKPDFLSIDVEGGEYDVLKGSVETMKSSIMAVCAEVAFQPIRNGQSDFGALCNFLSTQGFHFVSFADFGEEIVFQELSPYRYPIGLRGNGFHAISEVLFLRRIDAVENTFSDSLMRYVNLRKLGFIAIVYNQIEYGLECLRHSRVIHEKYEISFDSTVEPNYFKFLNELEQAEEKHPKLFPKTFRSIYTFEKSKGRFSEASKESFIIDNKRSQFKWIAKKIPGLRMLYKLMLRSKQYLTKKLKSSMFLRSDSYFEKVFIKYLLLDQARLLKQKRLTQLLHLEK